tara:strand:- start:435 stop:803 length:369 start_codon:yes stop_codon:yes gene_type:complete
MSDNTDNTDNTEYVSKIGQLIRDSLEEWEKIKKEACEKPRKIEPSIECYASNYRIMRILCNAAERKAEKESCRPGCYGAKQKFEETLDEMLSCDFKSDNEEDEEDGKDSNVVVEKPNDEKVD